MFQSAILQAARRRNQWMSVTVCRKPKAEDVAVVSLTTMQGLMRVLWSECNKDRPIPLTRGPLQLADLTSREVLSRSQKLRKGLMSNRLAEVARAAREEHHAIESELLPSPDAMADVKRAAATPTASSQSRWRLFLPRYPNLRDAAAGLATAFPGNCSARRERFFDAQARQVPAHLQYGGSCHRRSVPYTVVVGIGAIRSHFRYRQPVCKTKLHRSQMSFVWQLFKC
jgi:hypothetical protein